MTSRERVIAAISFKPPDRVPVNLNITLFAYQSLLAYLGLEAEELPSPNSAMEVVPSPDVLQRLGVDLISVKPEGKQAGKALPESITDSWGITRKLVRQSAGAYYEIISHPLADAKIDDINNYPWPECDPCERDEALHKLAKDLYTQTELALVGRFGGPILEIAAGLLGMEEWYVRLATDRQFVAALLEKISSLCTAQDVRGIESCREYLQIMKVSGEDFGMQTGPLYS